MTTALAVLPRAKSEPKRLARGAKAFSVTALRGHTIYPAPVAVGEFAGGEKIRMTFCQMAGKPWDFARARRLLAQAIGNERGRKGSAYVADLGKLHRKVEAARALMARPGSAGEGDAAKRALSRLSKAEKALAQKQAMAAAFDAMNVFARVHPPATDWVSFHVEHDGKRIDPAAVEEKRPPKLLRAARTRKSGAAIEAPAPEPVAASAATVGGEDTLAKLRAELGPDAVAIFLQVTREFMTREGKVRAYRSGKYYYRIHVHLNKAV